MTPNTPDELPPDRSEDPPPDTARPEYLDRDRFEALVIGSGFGGSVAACRLAQAGIDVAIVERGRRWRPGTFPRDLSRLDDGWLWLCDHGLYDAAPLDDILAVRAAGYGGGSLIYANVAVRAPDEVFDEHWPAAYTREALDPYYDLASHMLDVRPVTADPATGELPAKTGFMARAAERMGHADGFFHPNLAVTFEDRGPGQVNAFGVPQRGCTFTGECDIGCNVGAKNTLDLNYLALAERHGATVGVRTEAVHIARTDDGYRVRLREHGHPGAGRDGVERDVTARYVFLGAGALGTTELLLRSRDQYGTLPDLPATLGSRYSGNGDFLSFGHGVREPFAPHVGPTITTASVIRSRRAGTAPSDGAGRADLPSGADGSGDRDRDRDGVGVGSGAAGDVAGSGGASGTGDPGDPREHWFLLEEGGYSQQLAALVRTLHLSRLPRQVAGLVSGGTQRVMASARGLGAALDDRSDDTAVLLAMGRDRADGTIGLRGSDHRLRVRWDTARNSSLYAEEQAVSGEVVRAFGGRPFAMPTWRLFRQPVTVHNLGGAPMGEDPTTGVVDPDGEVFGHPGLFVLDGAALPGATGGNPSLTIAAVAERCVEAAVRRITGDAGWVAPQRADAVPRPVPEDAAVRAVVTRGPLPPAAARGVRFDEVMAGSARLPAPFAGDRRVVLRLTAHVHDLAALLDDPVHAVELTGTVEVAGMTAGPAPVHGGTLHLLAAVDGGPDRSMDYLLPFDDADGTRWLLQGIKHVRRRWNTDPWRATTRLDLAITRSADRYEGTVPQGQVRITVPETARLLASVRPTGSGGPGTVARFGAFFAGQVAAAFLTPARRSPRGPAGSP